MIKGEVRNPNVFSHIEVSYLASKASLEGILEGMPPAFFADSFEINLFVDTNFLPSQCLKLGKKGRILLLQPFFLSQHHNDIDWGKIHLFTEILVHQKKAKRIMMCLATLATTVYLCFNASSFFVSLLARSIIKNWKGDTHKLYYSNSLNLVLKRYLENVRKYYWKHLLLRWRLRFLQSCCKHLG